MNHATTEHFSKYLMRHVRFAYPTYMFGTPSLEIDENGHPWWVCERVDKTVGLIGGTDVIGVVLVDACDKNNIKYYDIEEVKTNEEIQWIDQIYSDDLLVKQYNYFGKYSGGFINAYIGQSGVVSTTAGSSYIASGDDVWLYTGVTSVTNDDSIVGFAIISFFMGHDIQIIYILEEAPDKHRAKIYSFLKSFGILGVILIPTLRDMLMGDDPTRWREIFLVPAIIGFVAVLLVLLFAKDTKVFLKERTAYLSIPYEVRKAEKQRIKEEKKAQRNQSGVFNAVKYIFANKDTKSLIISHIVFDAGMAAIALYYESSMHIAGMSTEDITKSLFILPVVYAVLTLFSGFVADFIGRKKTIIIAGILCVIGFVLFAAGINKLWNPYLIGGICGLYQGCYWIGRDYMNIMMTEKVPTDIRASVVGAEGLLTIIGLAVGYVLTIVGMLVMEVWLTCLLVALPCVIVAIIILALKVKETKGANLDEVGVSI